METVFYEAAETIGDFDKLSRESQRKSSYLPQKALDTIYFIFWLQIPYILHHSYLSFHEIYP